MDKQQIQLTGWRLRYALEKAAVATTEFVRIMQESIQDELDKLRQLREQERHDRLLREAEYQEWRRQQEERAL